MTPSDDISTRRNIQILHGDDTFSIQREFRRAAHALSGETDSGMNTLRLDGRTASLEDISTAVTTLPFFGGDRLVILDSMPAKLDKARQDKFLKILDGIPVSTILLLVMEDHRRWRREGEQWLQVWDTLNESHWLMKWTKDRQNVSVQAFPLPDAREMDAWIQKEAGAQGGKLSPEAAHELSQSVGNDTSIASQEIGKLLMYVNGARPVSREDVILLVSDAGSSDVFSMLDAMVEGHAREAQKMLHKQLDDTPPEVILGAVIHRFRQLIQVREALDQGEDLRGLIAQRVIFAGKQAERTAGQARRLPMAHLKQIYRHLLELDIQSKTSQLDLSTGLEVLAVELAGK